MAIAYIIGPSFYNFTTAVAAAFHSLGYETAQDCYDDPIHPYSLTAKLRYKAARNKEVLKEKNRNSLEQYYIDRFNTICPDIVFILNGDKLTIGALDHFRKKGAKVIIWCFDSITRFPYTAQLIDHCDLFLCYEKSDIDYYASIGKKAFFLPQACDTSIYYPIEGSAKEIDILFVGDLYHSPKRQRIAKKIVNTFTDKKIKIVGLYKPWYKNPLKCLLRERRDIYTNHNISPKEVNTLYNRSKVVVNIHNEQQKDGANPKVFEISGSGATQVCDANPFIQHLFPKNEILLYNSDDEMVAKIAEALKAAEIEKVQRSEAYYKVIKDHTFENRISQALAMLNGEKIECAVGKVSQDAQTLE